MKTSTLTLAGISTDQIKAILTIAQTLQKNYNTLGAPGSQNVRNPRPLRQLIVAALPHRRKQAMTRTELAASLESLGYRISHDFIHLSIELRKLLTSGIVRYEGHKPNSRSARFWVNV